MLETVEGFLVQPHNKLPCLLEIECYRLPLLTYHLESNRILEHNTL